MNINRSASRVFCLAVGAVWSIVGLGTGMASEMVVRFQGANPGLPVSFEYPTGWKAEESSGNYDVYTQVQVFGPKSLEDRMGVYLVVRAVPLKEQGGRFTGLADRVAHFRQTLPSSMTIRTEEIVEFLGVDSMHMSISGTLKPGYQVTDALEIPIKSERIFLEKSDYLYEFAWMATPEASQEVAGAFKIMLDTLRIEKDIENLPSKLEHTTGLSAEQLSSFEGNE